MALRLTVTAKGRVTLPKALLEHLGVAVGDEIVVELLPSGRIGLRAAGRTIESVFGRLHDPAEPTLSIDEINEIIADGWAGSR